MLYDVLHFQENSPMKGKVLSFELDRTGLARSSRSVKADIAQWDNCLECDEFDRCYKFYIAKLLPYDSIENETSTNPH